MADEEGTIGAQQSPADQTQTAPAAAPLQPVSDLSQPTEPSEQEVVDYLSELGQEVGDEIDWDVIDDEMIAPVMQVVAKQDPVAARGYVLRRNDYNKRIREGQAQTAQQQPAPLPPVPYGQTPYGASPLAPGYAQPLQMPQGYPAPAPSPFRYDEDSEAGRLERQLYLVQSQVQGMAQQIQDTAANQAQIRIQQQLAELEKDFPQLADPAEARRLVEFAYQQGISNVEAAAWYKYGKSREQKVAVARKQARQAVTGPPTVPPTGGATGGSAPVTDFNQAEANLAAALRRAGVQSGGELL